MKLYIEINTDSDRIGPRAIQDLSQQIVDALWTETAIVGGAPTPYDSQPLVHVLTIDPLTNIAVTAQLLRKPRTA